MKRFGMCGVLLLALSLPGRGRAQAVSAPGCPVEFKHFDPSGVSVRITNPSPKMIVGLSFVAALADATEHWRWLHYDFADWRQLHEFGWNKEIKPGASKTLSWDRANLDFQHGGGGAFVLISVLYADGTTWEEARDRSTCKVVWYNNHKEMFVHPVDLPPRPPK